MEPEKIQQDFDLVFKYLTVATKKVETELSTNKTRLYFTLTNEKMQTLNFLTTQKSLT